MQQHASHDSHAAKTGHGGSYGRLALMLVVSFAAMYALMYAMVDRFANVYSSLNQVYMAGVMTAAMLVIELALMGSMYPNRKANLALLAGGVLVGIGFWMGIREQVAIGDEQFLRSMIPHHAGAILMCEQAPIADPEVVALCREIVVAQREEIAQMRALLGERR